MPSLTKLIAMQKIYLILSLFSLLLFGSIPNTYAAATWQDVSSTVTTNTSSPLRSRRSPDATVKVSISNTHSSDLAGPFRLVIKDLNSSAAVSIANATGLTVAGDSYFDLNDLSDTFVQGTKSDDIVVQVAGGRNIFSFSTVIEQWQEDEIIPEEIVVKITAPATLTTVGASPLAIQGTISDPDATLTINGATITHSSGNFSASVALEEGHNTISARMVAVSGAETTDSISIALDTTAPFITIESPEDGSTVNIESIAVTGLVNDIVRGTVSETQASVQVNNATATVANRSYLAQAVTLNEGENTLTVTGSDEQGNTASKTITVTYEVPEAKHIELVSGQNQTAKILTVLAQPLKVKLIDGSGNPAVDTNVVYRVIQGDGILGAGSAEEGQGVLSKTDAEGIASINFTLGTRSGQGNQRVRAQAVGFDGEVIFYASAESNPGNKVSINSGNNQRGSPKQVLPQPFIVAVTDIGANLVKGAKIEFTVTAGGGKFQNGNISYISTTDSDGRASASLTLGELVGLDVHRVTATLVGTALNAGFSASALETADPGLTTITGLVFDNQDAALPNVTIRIEGSNRQAVTNTQGQFTITEAPVGPVHLLVDGSTTTVAGEWPTLSYNIVTIAGAENPLASPIYMVKLDTENSVYVGKQDQVLTLDEVPGFKLEVKANSVTFPDGAREGYLSVTPVNSSKIPMAPPNGMQPQFIVTIQPAGAKFDPPAPLTLPNVDGHAAGAQVEMYSYDHDLEEFVAIGLGTVSRDGTLVASNIGVGVIKAGWHCGSQPTGQGCCGGGTGAGSCPTCKKAKDNDCSSGDCVADDSQDPGECKTCSGGSPIPDNSKKPTGDNAECKLCFNGSPSPNLAKNGSKCSSDPTKACYTCEGGECKNNCDASSDKVTLSKSGDPKFNKAAEIFLKGINKIPNLKADIKLNYGGALTTGEECCVDCSSSTPKAYSEVSGSGELVGSLLIVPVGYLVDDEYDLGSFLGTDYSVAYEFVLGVFIEGELKAGAGVKYKATACPNDDNCATVNIGASGKLAGGVTGRASAEYIEKEDGKKVYSQGIGGKIEGRAVTGYSVNAQAVSPEGATCGSTECKIGWDAVKLQAEASFFISIAFIKEEFSVVKSITVTEASTSSCL